MNKGRIAGVLVLAVALGAGESLQAQQNPAARLQPKGLGVSPTFEGWYENPDGTYTLSWGFMNRNTEQILTIPAGSNNSVSPGTFDQGQPTHFIPRRTYGLFTVTVPADFGTEERVTWTLEANGERYGIPGGLISSYETDNLYARGTDRYPPVVVLEEGGKESRGPNGVWIGPLAARVGQPLSLTVTAWDEDEREVNLRWFKYDGPGEVTFEEQEMAIAEGSVEATTTASFSEPGNYVVFVRAGHTDTRVASAGMEQCCRTNGYVRVTVAR